MIYDTKISIAIKCDDGGYRLYRISLFQLEALNKIKLIKGAKINKDKELEISIKCPICDNLHFYKFKLFDEEESITIRGCVSSGSPIIIVGKDELVNEYISVNNSIERYIYAML
ncbi:hypothetical protein [Clostridium cellulovorans]|uniref:Uncharacterized protein n=1 Tax=Clostridium cellulovorans (strain ATCC 35296 / DSM 3052 / OCM 3 / 743B) TaxID=573061 RepID=D9STN0_CLOC7|nr:hypothetical protein [Clostridium cellulovorans]ADL52764.1 hypothetical protein Clocel_3074 [Clostridium cellulovorans 743B]